MLLLLLLSPVQAGAQDTQEMQHSCRVWKRKGKQKKGGGRGGGGGLSNGGGGDLILNWPERWGRPGSPWPRAAAFRPTLARLPSQKRASEGMEVPLPTATGKVQRKSRRQSMAHLGSRGWGGAGRGLPASAAAAAAGHVQRQLQAPPHVPRARGCPLWHRPPAPPTAASGRGAAQGEAREARRGEERRGDPSLPLAPSPAPAAASAQLLKRTAWLHCSDSPPPNRGRAGRRRGGPSACPPAPTAAAGGGARWGRRGRGPRRRSPQPGSPPPQSRS